MGHGLGLGRAAVVAVLAVAGALASAAPAQAEETFAVLDVRAKGSDDVFARLLTDALREQMAEQSELRETDRRPSLDVVEAVGRCDRDDHGCVAEALGRTLRADWVLYGALARVADSEDDAFRVALRLYSVEQGRFAANLVTSILPGDGRDMSDRAARYVAGLLRQAGLGPEARARREAERKQPAQMVRVASAEGVSRAERGRRLRRAGGGLIGAGGALIPLAVGTAFLTGGGGEVGGTILLSLPFVGALSLVAGTGVLAAGLGYGGPEERAVVVAPSVGPNGAALTGRVRF